MRVIYKKARREAAGSRHKSAPARSHPATPSPAAASLSQPESYCACGGGCPRCRDGHATQTTPSASAPGDARDLLPSAGEPLAPAARTFFEPRFGRDFGRVRVHAGDDAAESARALDAAAYTVGTDVVFGTGRYAPDTTEGRRLLAHELTHVIQQADGGGARPALVQRQAFPAKRTPKEMKAACMEQTDDILPDVGVVASIDREVQLRDILGADYDSVRKQIKADLAARDFVCEAGVPAVIALADTRAAGALDVAAARERFTKRPALYTRGALERRPQEQRIEGAAAKLEEVDRFAEARAQLPGVPSTTGVEGPLPADQLANLDGAIKQLQDSVPFFEQAKERIAKVKPHFDAIKTRLNEAKAHAGDEFHAGSLASIKLKAAADEAEAARAALDLVNYRFDVTPHLAQLVTLKAGIKALADSTAASDSVSTRDINDMRDNVLKVEKSVQETRDKLDGMPQAARRLLFVFRYFRALNTEGFAGAPAAAEVKSFAPKLDELYLDIELIFAAGLSVDLNTFLSELAGRIKAQIEVRATMEKSLKRETALVPPQADAETYFASLAAGTNDEVSEAYVKYAEAFYEHRGVSSREDLLVTSLGELFARPLSIAGTRPLVCTGFAILGARLFERAGARLDHFILGVRASDDQLVSGNDLDDAHALARLRRNGKTFFVSNDSVVDTQAAGIGPGAVAWTNRTNPIFVATGTTIELAVTNVEQRLATEAARVRRRRNP